MCEGHYIFLMKMLVVATMKPLLLVTYTTCPLFSLTVGAPEIIQHPKSKSVVTGSLISFTIEATGDDLQFQWQKNCKDLSDGVKYHGADTDTLQISKLGKDDEGHYRCLVKNDVGMEFSDEALLNVSKLLIVVGAIVHDTGMYLFHQKNCSSEN